jgi:hypothetical protein
MPDVVADLEQQDADASPETYVDRSVDTSVQPAEVESKAEETEVEQESEVDPSSAEVEVLDSKADSDDSPDPEYGEKVKARIDKLTSWGRDTERTNEELKRELAAAREKLAAAAPEPEPFKTLEDFEYDQGKFNAYLATEIDRRASDAVDRKFSGYESKVSLESSEQRFRDREKAFAENVPDYYDKVYGMTDGQRTWVASNAMVQEIQASDIGEEVAYYLSNQPEIAAELFKSSDREVIRKMARLEDTLKSEKVKAAAKPVTKAPPPVPKIRKGDGSLEKDPADMSDAEFRKWRGKQIAQR